jgi:hypothetical protein
MLQSSELERELYELNRMLQAAHRSSIDIKNSYEFNILAIKELNKDNLLDAFLYYDRSKYELTNAINEAKHNLRGLRIHSLTTISFFFKLYGLYAVVFGMLSCFFIWLSNISIFQLDHTRRSTLGIIFCWIGIFSANTLRSDR